MTGDGSEHLPKLNSTSALDQIALLGFCDGSSTAPTATALGSTTTTATTTNTTTANAGRLTVAFEAVLCRSPAGFRRVLITHCISALDRGGGGCLSNMWIVAWKISPKSTRGHEKRGGLGMTEAQLDSLYIHMVA